MEAMSGMLLLLIACFGALLSILWLLVPFAIFGIKPLLGRILAEQRHTNALLTALVQQQSQNEIPPPAAEPGRAARIDPTW